MSIFKFFSTLTFNKNSMGICGISYEDLPNGKSISILVTQLGQTLWNPMDCSLSVSSVNGILENAREGCHSFLQGIFPTQGSNQDFPNCRLILYLLSHQGSPKSIKPRWKPENLVILYLSLCLCTHLCIFYCLISFSPSNLKKSRILICHWGGPKDNIISIKHRIFCVLS